MNHTEEEFAATCASLRDALNLILIEGKVYAAHNKLPHVAQTMYDIAEAALSDNPEGDLSYPSTSETEPK
jgi:hypothetical protein